MKAFKTFLMIIGSLVVITFLLIALGSGSSETTRKSFETQVAEDFERQYADVKQYGSDVDRCVQAGLVAQGYLQAGHSEHYQVWKEVERQDCKSAGVPR